MDIDHVFIFVEPDGPDLKYLKALGLVETYRRTHAGQGTQNICFCFDNMFLECLWVSNAAELRSDAIARTRLFERSQWRSAGTCPFGIAWRGTAGDPVFDTPSWSFQPPYLPAGLPIEVSPECDDPRQPMMFRSPGATPPSQWAPERRAICSMRRGSAASWRCEWRGPGALRQALHWRRWRAPHFWMSGPEAVTHRV